jgi:hypothetical protein
MKEKESRDSEEEKKGRSESGLDISFGEKKPETGKTVLRPVKKRLNPERPPANVISSSQFPIF